MIEPKGSPISLGSTTVDPALKGARPTYLPRWTRALGLWAEHAPSGPVSFLLSLLFFPLSLMLVLLCFCRCAVVQRTIE